jgi:hypothetical protein
LLPAREMVADLLLENGEAPEALKEYEAILKTMPRRLNATGRRCQGGGQRRQGNAGFESSPMARRPQTVRTEWARVYLGSK